MTHERDGGDYADSDHANAMDIRGQRVQQASEARAARQAEQRAARLEQSAERSAEQVAQQRSWEDARQADQRGVQAPRQLEQRGEQGRAGQTQRAERNRSYTDPDRNRSYVASGSGGRDNSNWQGEHRDENTWLDDRRDANSWASSDRRYNGRSWDRAWRDNGRYDWQRYRNSHRSAYDLGAYSAPYRYYSYRRFGVGSHLNSQLFGNSYWITNPWQYRLPDVWGPYRWVRYYDDVMLVDIYSGQVVDVIHDFFW